MSSLLYRLHDALHRHHHHSHHAARHGHRGFAGCHSWPGFSRGSRDDGIDSLNRGRKLGSADLQLLLLALLAERPSHGYELIKALDERSNGYYAPSPGMVYPALTYLEEIGYATVEADGSRKLYHITASGQAHLDENRSMVDSMFAQFDRVGEKMERMRRAFSGDEAAGAHPDDSSSVRRGSKELLLARHELKAALATAAQSPEEEERIAEVLRRAAAEIRSKSPTGS